MRGYYIEIVASDGRPSEHLFVSIEDINRLRTEAGVWPIASQLARHIVALAWRQGYRLTQNTAQLRDMAHRLLMGEMTTVQVLGCHFVKSPVSDVSVLSDMTAKKCSPLISASSIPGTSVWPPLCLARYNNLAADRERLISALCRLGRLPVTWSRTQGLRLDEPVRRLGLSLPTDISSGNTLQDPAALLTFIGLKPNPTIAYVLENFQYYLSSTGIVGSEIGELHALLRDLHQTLSGRDELVCLLVPSSYDPPPDLAPFLQPLPDFTLADLDDRGILDHYGRLLSGVDALAQGKPVIGMDDHIWRCIQILCQLEANNPLLVGRPGVGKTAIVEGLARAMAAGRVPYAIRGRHLYQLSLTSLVAGTRFRGDLESRLDALIGEVLRRKNQLILFIDEIHILVQAGQTEGSVGVAETLKPALARGEFPCIGATTPEGEDRLAADPALSRRFKKILVHEPNRKTALAILAGIAPCFERHHRVTIASAALDSAVDLSVELLPAACLPGKAVALLDGAASGCALQGKRWVTANDVRAEALRMLYFESSAQN
ncbi:AAA ATPase domain protein [Desulfovibrionales bacterium]